LATDFSVQGPFNNIFVKSGLITTPYVPAPPCSVTIAKSPSDLASGHHYMQLATGDTANNKISLNSPFGAVSATAGCGTWYY
jgi:hypothetical protein